MFINTRHGVSEAQAEAAIQPVVDQYGSGDLQSRASTSTIRRRRSTQLLALIYGLLALSIVIAAVGIVITLLLSVYERRREIALLRAVGMTRSQVWSTVSWESVITSLLGAVLGVILGLDQRLSVRAVAARRGRHRVLGARVQHDRDPGRVVHRRRDRRDDSGAPRDEGRHHRGDRNNMTVS